MLQKTRDKRWPDGPDHLGLTMLRLDMYLLHTVNITLHDKTVLLNNNIDFLVGDERLSDQQEEIEAEEPTLPPTHHRVTVGNLLVIYSHIKQHKCKNIDVGITFYFTFVEISFFIKD